MVTLSNFYQSKEWEKLRDVIINQRLNSQGEIICEECGQPITHKYDCIGHHKIYLTEQNVNDASIALNPDNIALVHMACHNRIHEKGFKYVERLVYVVYGAPLSGKTSYVQSIKQDGDLIVDIDSIWQCVSGCERYVKPERLNAVVFGIRNELIDMVKHRVGKWRNAFVIGGYALSGERERLITSLGARSIFIDTSKEECLERLHSYSDGRSVDDWERYIEDWFRKFYGSTPPTSA